MGTQSMMRLYIQIITDTMQSHLLKGVKFRIITIQLSAIRSKIIWTDQSFLDKISIELQF